MDEAQNPIDTLTPIIEAHAAAWGLEVDYGAIQRAREYCEGCVG